MSVGSDWFARVESISSAVEDLYLDGKVTGVAIGLERALTLANEILENRNPDSDDTQFGVVVGLEELKRRIRKELEGYYK